MWLTVLLLMIFGLVNVETSQPSVTIGSSTVYGLSTQVTTEVKEMVGETTVHKYLGIRFGQPPVGPLRFSKPLPATLPAIVNATEYGHPCLGTYSPLPMNEDCLFLSVYVPSSIEGGRTTLPVMVWIYGGSFTRGSEAEFDGSLLAAEGHVIVVTLNYRVGPFGFLSTGNNSSLGNYGLWDQWLALKWVNDNIQEFGGNVTQITLFGESAGSACVNFQMTSPYSSGLFQRVILQSGCRLCSFAYSSPVSALESAKQLGHALQCPTDDNDPESMTKLVECLRQKPFALVNSSAASISGWTPVIDGDFVLPYNNSQKFSGSIMTGLNNYEGGFVLSTVRPELLGQENVRSFYQTIILKGLLGQLYGPLVAAADPQALQKTIDLLDCVYRGNGSNTTFVPDTDLEAVSGDAYFFVCNQQLLDGDPTTADVYEYYFDHFPDFPGGEKGLNHGYDLDYTFGILWGLRAVYSPFASQNVSQADLNLAISFRSLLTNFATSGNPNQPADLPNWPRWPTYTKGDKYYMVVSSSPEVRSRLKGDLMTVWLQTIPALLKSQDAVDLNVSETVARTNTDDHAHIFRVSHKLL